MCVYVCVYKSICTYLVCDELMADVVCGSLSRLRCALTPLSAARAVGATLKYVVITISQSIDVYLLLRYILLYNEYSRRRCPIFCNNFLIMWVKPTHFSCFLEMCVLWIIRSL